jgi:hypothetical protein
MADKKISELPIASSINPSDVSVLVGTDTDYQFSFTTMLSFVSENLSVGSQNSFGTTIPQNNTGNNGDVFLKTDTATFYQKINGTWALVYTIPTGSGSDGTLLYGIGEPGSIIGADNNSYIDTNSGIFYLKTSGNWAQVFSMATGPQGPQGTAGINGINGLNGNTILHGTTNPSNMADGANGDFYINLSSLYFFGPKTAGVWPAGFSIVPDSIVDPLSQLFMAGDANPLVIANWQINYAPQYSNAKFLVRLKTDNGNLQDRPEIQPERIIDRTGTQPAQTGITLDTTGFPDGQLIIYYSNEPII